MSKITLEEFRDFRDALWQINGATSDKHTAAFPVEIPRRLTMMYSFIGDTVLDPFLGSGTTTRAALEMGRNSVGIEINPDFRGYMEEKLGLNGIESGQVATEAQFEITDTYSGETGIYYNKWL